MSGAFRSGNQLIGFKPPYTIIFVEIIFEEIKNKVVTIFFFQNESNVDPSFFSVLKKAKETSWMRFFAENAKSGFFQKYLFLWPRADFRLSQSRPTVVSFRQKEVKVENV